MKKIIENLQHEHDEVAGILTSPQSIINTMDNNQKRAGWAGLEEQKKYLTAMAADYKKAIAILTKALENENN